MEKLLVVWGEHFEQKTYDLYLPLKNIFEISFLIPLESKEIKEDGMKVYYQETTTYKLEAFARRNFILLFFIKKFFTKEFKNFNKYAQGVDIIHAEETYRWPTQQILKRKKDFNYKIALTVWENIPFIKGKRLQFELGDIMYSKVFKLNPSKDNYYQSERKYIRDNVDLFIATSERAKEALIIEGYDAKKIHVIMPSINTDLFKPDQKDKSLLKRLGIKENEIVITTISRLVWEKGIYEFIYAAFLLVNRYKIKNIKFLLIGRGEISKPIHRLINTLSLGQHVIMLEDPIPHDDLPRYFNISDIFTLNSIPAPYWQEQIGQVLIESMSSGTITVTAQSGSIPEVVGDAALLVQPGDFHALAGLLNDLINNKDKYSEYKNKGREQVIKNFTSLIYANKLHTALSLLNKSTSKER